MKTVSSTARKNKKTYINIYAAKWAGELRGLAMGPKSLILLLAQKSDDFGTSWRKQETMALELGCSVRSIRNYLQVLKTAGLVRSIGRSNQMRQISNAYLLLGWPGRTPLPRDGHPRLGPGIKEPPREILLDAKRRQDLQQEAAMAADRNYTTNKSTTLEEEAREEILAECLDALGGWLSEVEKNSLRNDRDALFELVDHGCSPEAHILPVLRRKAQTRRTIRHIRTWYYFAEAIQEHAEKNKEEMDRSFRKSLPITHKVDPARAKDRAKLDQAIENLTRSRASATNMTEKKA